MKKLDTDTKIPILSWCDDLENGALEQAINLANHPVVVGHVVLLPDCHQGYGMPIGGVIACRNAVIPNAVGCFTGDTKIPLLDGTQKTLKELYKNGKSVYVYSLNKDGKIVPGKGVPKLTRQNTSLIEVVISGGEKIRCTPDHKFMLLDGSYKEAQNLKTFDSLMPLYRTYQSRDGYERVRVHYKQGINTHKMVTEYFYGTKKDDEIIHHKDGNWFNNDPSNLTYVDKKLHSSQHRKNNPIFGTEEFKKKRLEKLREKGFYDPKYKEKKKQVAIANITKYMNENPEEWKEKIKDNGKRGREYLIKYNKSKKSNNHKVLSTKKLSYKRDVYCLTVEKYHNFALSAGVFVHNCDIGCGMGAIQTGIRTDNITKGQLRNIINQIKDRIPMGEGHAHKEPQIWMEMDNFTSSMRGTCKPNGWFSSKMWHTAKCNLGTLGGGNHFIEIQKGSDGYIWLMLHSGSRNLGYQIAKYYNDVAKKVNQKWYSAIPCSDLAFLPTNSQESQDYIYDMNFTLAYAQENRNRMMRVVKECVFEVLPCEFLKEINIHHNYAAIENHLGKNLWIHRKGATSARDGQLGIIPGAMGSFSYIVAGKGVASSFQSCSHGAGRTMSRTKASATLNREECDEAMEGVVWDGFKKRKGRKKQEDPKYDLSESPQAYKDIASVMEAQKDLVEIVVELKTLAVLKG